MKIFIHFLLIIGLVDPGVSLAKSTVEANKSDIGTEISDTTDGDELIEKKNGTKALNKALFGAGLFAAAIIRVSAKLETHVPIGFSGNSGLIPAVLFC